MNENQKGPKTLMPENSKSSLVYPEKNELEDNEVEDGNTKMYQIYCDETEFYTPCKPLIKNCNLFGKKLIKKSVVKQENLPEKLIAFFAEECEDKIFDLSTGIILKAVDIDKLEWLNVSKEEAEKKLKDDLLLYYQKLVPKLIKQLEETNNMFRQQQSNNNMQQRRETPPPYQTNNLLI